MLQHFVHNRSARSRLGQIFIAIALLSGVFSRLELGTLAAALAMAGLACGGFLGVVYFERSRRGLD